MVNQKMIPLGEVTAGNDTDGHEPESEEQLKTVLLKLDNLKRQDGSVVTLGKQELGLLQSILKTSTEKYREETIFRMMDFLDDDEALDHVAAYYEAKELGMDTTFNVAYMFALCSVNRKGSETNLIASMMDCMQMGKWASNNKQGKKDDSRNPRSPIA